MSSSLDWPTLFEYEKEWLAASSAKKARCPAETFCDARLEIADTNFGRGLIAASSVDEGELLLMCQALVTAPQADLQAAAIDKLQTCSEEDYEQFKSLQGWSNDLIPASQLDCNLQSWTRPSSRSKDANSRNLDAKKVQRVLQLNSLARDVVLENGAVDQSPMHGLWPLASLINHSCRPNVVEQFLGDLLLLRAATDIPAGQELLMSYVSTLQPRHVRQKYLQETFNFTCSCMRCTLEAERLKATEVQPVLEQLDSLVRSGKTLPEFLERLEELARKSREVITGALSPGGPAATQSEERLLTACFLPVFMGLAFARKRMGAEPQALESYAACAELLAEVHRGSMYHVHWALEQALQAHNQAESNLKHLGTDALWFCYTFIAPDIMVCTAVATRAGWPKELLELLRPAFELFKQERCRDSRRWNFSVEEDQKFISVSIALPEGLDPADVNIDLAPQQVCLVAGGYPDLVIPLPAPVNAADAAPAKYKRNGRKLVLRLPT